MANLRWLANRLFAMSPAEVLWRIQQKGLQQQEEKQFKGKNVSVCASVFNPALPRLKFNATALHLNLQNTKFGLNEDISLLGFKCTDFKGKWHAGFQTETEWPREFSYSLEYKQRDEIGDARTNWELNRCFQFAILAKNYHASGKRCYLEDLRSQFDSWDEQNPFLTGISWTSTMEFAVRAINWMYTLAFLEKEDSPVLKRKLEIGVLNMVDYAEQHRSRYSSANNHLLVEAAAIGIAGIAFNYEKWINLGIDVLTEELPKQHYSDGVNKELSLHYQIFAMEAYGLLMNLLKKNDLPVPSSWVPALKKQCQFVSDCRGKHGEVVVFGDDDEGKILDLVGRDTDRYAYVLQLFSCLLDTRFDEMKSADETISWLFTDEEIQSVCNKSQYDNTHNTCYKEGGNTILKSQDGRILIGIDHADLGFGSIAAHGHADALSFQMFVDGKPVFIDPGTFIYHCNLSMRNKLRKTISHNTVCIDNKDQSEMLGAFLWGRKADCKLISYDELPNGGVRLVAEHDGYAPTIHRRTFEFNGEDKFIVVDDLLHGLSEKAEMSLCCFYPINYDEKACVWNSGSCQIELSGLSKVAIELLDVSGSYGNLATGNKLTAAFQGQSSRLTISVREATYGNEHI